MELPARWVGRAGRYRGFTVPSAVGWGLGVDQITGLRVVLADETIVDADNALLWGIGCAGGTLGSDCRAYNLSLLDSHDLSWIHSVLV